jgi:sarcosine oxidase subunit gamma
MAMTRPAPVFPLSPDGAAAGTKLPNGALTLSDLTGWRRFGLKGAGSAIWLRRQGAPLPEINHLRDWQGMQVLRLGREDIVLLGNEVSGPISALVATWMADPNSRGYSSWREEGWAWFRLSGAGADDAMAQLCAVDLRFGKFGADQVAQTRVGGIDTVTFRCDGGFDFLLDITATAHFANTIETLHRFSSLRKDTP